jgi:hypothetical protein
MYLNMLGEMLGEKKNTCLFPCIRDLVANGLDPARFSDEDNTPTRQDVTQHMTAWFKYIVNRGHANNYGLSMLVDVHEDELKF